MSFKTPTRCRWRLPGSCARYPSRRSSSTGPGSSLYPGKLFLVGDPKQSIYRFRRADIGMYDDVKQRLQVGTDGARLTQNFRSVERVVAWVNYHFGQDMQAERRVQPAYVDLIGGPVQTVSVSSTAHSACTRLAG